jgi:predicted dehydrogenase
VSDLGVAVVGAGNAGLEHARAFAGATGARLAGIVDPDADRARQALDAAGVDAPVWPRLADALADPAVGAVVVASPSDLHAEHAVAAASTGRHVLLEKPAALSREELDRIERAVDEAGVLCQVDMILRWHPMIEAIVAARDAGDLGEVFCVEADFVFGELEGAEPDWARVAARAGSLHLYAGCHAYDQLEWLAGDRVTSISAVSTRRSARWEYDVTSCAIVRFARGAIGRATVTLEAAAPYRFGVRVFGTRGTVVDNTVCVPATGSRYEELTPRRVDVTYLPFDRVAADFVANVAAGRESHASLRRTRDLFELALDAERAAGSGAVVRR